MIQIMGDTAPRSETACLRMEKSHLDAFNNAQYNAMGDGIIAVTCDGRVLLSDRISREKLNITQGIFLGARFPHLWEKILEVFDDRRPRFELSLQNGDSSFLVTATPTILDAEVVGAICVFVESTDIETLARQLRSYRELSKELAAIIDSSSEGLWICDGEEIGRASCRERV